MSDKKYSIFRMRNGGKGNQIIFPETHADAVHTTKQRMFVNAAEKKTINMMVGSPLLDFDQEDQKTKFDKLFELSDNIDAIKDLINNISTDKFNYILYNIDKLQPIVSSDNLQRLLSLLDQPDKYDLAVVPGNDGNFYKMSVEPIYHDDAPTEYKQIYSRFEPSLVEPNIGAIYVPQTYAAGEIWKVPLGAENIKLNIPLSKGILVTDNSLRNGQIDTWEDILADDKKLKVTYYSSIDQNVRFDPSENSSPYFWMVWNVGQFLKDALKITYQKEDIQKEYEDIKSKIVNFTESLSYRPLQTGAVTKLQPYINNTYYENHIEENGDSTLLLNQSITPNEIGMGINNIDTDILFNGDKEQVATILKGGEESSFEFSRPNLTIEIENPFKGKTLKCINSSDGTGFKLSDWKIEDK